MGGGGGADTGVEGLMADVCDDADTAIEAFAVEALRNTRRAQATSCGHNPLGICYGCGDPIPPARLAILPGALRCTSCQQDHTVRSRG